MLNLTSAADFSKRASFWIVAGTIAIIVLIVFVIFGKSIKDSFFPAPPLPQTVAFGQLPKADLSEGVKAVPNLNYSLQTISGDFPKLPSEAKVFAIAKDEPSFAASGNAKNLAQTLGFDKEPVENSNGMLKFGMQNKPDITLSIDIVSGNFEFLTNYLNNPSILNSKPKSVEDARQMATDFVKKMNLNLNEFPKDRIQTQMFRVDGGNLIDSSSLSTTNLIEVDFNHADIDMLPVIYPQSRKADVFAITSAGDVVASTSKLLKIQRNQFATYPLKTPSAAFEDLKAGNGAFNDKIINSDVTVIDVSLGYVASLLNKDYLEPMYFFKTANGPTAYIEAVDPKWIK